VLDLRLIRDRPEEVERRLADKGGAEYVREIRALDTQRRPLLREAEELKAERNRASEAIGQAKRRGEDASTEMARMREVGDRIKALDGEVAALDERIQELLAQIPNVPHPSVPPGASDADNVEVRRWGTPRAFAFAPKPHEEVGAGLGRLAESAPPRSPRRTAVMWGPLAAVSAPSPEFMPRPPTRTEHSYAGAVATCSIVNGTPLRGQLPGSRMALFKTVEADDSTLYLIPTAGGPAERLRSGGFLPARQLPALHRLHPVCYRREGRHVRPGHERASTPAPVRAR
jgi:seryl-tRNA synthetase